ncbi:TIGR02391 family protein [Paenibacillus chitinolyticus]|uniref:TIGR02391 family protein n=1 Tax=Paenibacillus chitinolyticus TaxID=79263 RepID=UPI002DB726AD|nr:TIGR02391 family protein [Paenibacillus chitinolyticus]MEC0249346.1 TIGR02391 family protein [Paenibacillus chitinolyticus]
MTSKIMCPLCRNEAVQKDRNEVHLINCQSCGEFQIHQAFLEDLPAERKFLPQLIKVSAFTRFRTINNELVATLFIGDPKGYSEGYSIQQIIDQFPAVLDRKLKTLQNLKGLSKYWGNAVSIDRKDSSVFFPEINEEQPILMMMRTLVEEGLVSGEVKLPTQLTVTEKGYSLLRGQASPLAQAAPSTSAPKAPVIDEPPTPVVQPSKLEGLHPKVLAKVEKLFQDGHYRSAVLDTYVALNKEVQRKSRLSQDGSSLMQKAFSKDKPTLKVAGGDDPQMGANWLFSGAMMGVRNVLAHDDLIHPSEQEALELLYFASMLFRRLDLAVNVEAERLMGEISQLSFKLNGNESSSNSTKLKAYLAPSREYVDSALHRLCFLKILEIIKSGYFNDQNVGIDLLLEGNATILDHITDDDHIELICYIYKAAGSSYPSHSAEVLIRNGFKPITKSLKLFQAYLLSSTEIFYGVLEKIWWKDAFFKSIVNYAELEFLVPLLNKIINNEIVLMRPDLNTLSNELYRAGRGIEELTDKIDKMNEGS